MRFLQNHVSSYLRLNDLKSDIELKFHKLCWK